MPAANARLSELSDVVDLHHRRTNKPSQLAKRTTSGPTSESPNDIG